MAYSCQRWYKSTVQRNHKAVQCMRLTHAVTHFFKYKLFTFHPTKLTYSLHNPLRSATSNDTIRKVGISFLFAGSICKAKALLTRSKNRPREIFRFEWRRASGSIAGKVFQFNSPVQPSNTLLLSNSTKSRKRVRVRHQLWSQPLRLYNFKHDQWKGTPSIVCHSY